MVSPGMSDGRCFTNYQPNCQYNANIMKNLKLVDNNQYRQFLQENTSEILKTYHNICLDKCSDCIHQPLKQQTST
jgi:hypothetical protein